jgi:parallel beta-helix repeat protein
MKVQQYYFTILLPFFVIAKESKMKLKPKLYSKQAIFCCILFGKTVMAADYYVSPNGTSTWDSATNINTPTSIYTAMERAMAGDTVYFRGGKYNIPYENKSVWVGLLSPANTGNAGNPITFTAYPDEVPVLNVSGDYGNDEHVIVFATGENNSYITFDGFTIQGNNGRKSSGVAGFGRRNALARGLEFRNLIINGGSDVIASTNNEEGIRLENTNGALISNCKIHNFRQTTDWPNTVAIKMYYNRNTIIEHNEIFNNSGGIYLKSRNHNSIIRYNYVHDTHHHGIFIGMFSYRNAGTGEITYRNSHNNKIHDNLVAGVGYMSISTRTEDDAFGNDNHIFNNTIYDCKYCIYTGDGEGGRVYNNIVVPWDASNYYPAVIAKNNWNFDQYDYNLWSNNRSFKAVTNFEVSGQTTYNSLEDFRNSGVAPGVAQHSFYTEPQFVNHSGTMSEIGDFAQPAGHSPGYDGRDMGADIALVGLTDGAGGDAHSYTVLNPDLTSSVVMSLADNNVITVGDTTLNLDLYERGVISNNSGALTQGAVVTGTGPFEMGSGRNATDMPAHASLAGVQFAMPHERHSHWYHMVSPQADAMAQITVDGVEHQVTLPQGVVVDFDAGETNGNVSAVINSDRPILVSHRGEPGSGSGYSDASPVAPTATELWGIRSKTGLIAAVEDDTTVTLYGSDGSTRTMTLNAGQKGRINVGQTGEAAKQGGGSAIHLVADKPIGAVQVADGDGADQTAFFPTSLLSTRFGVPKDAQYIAIVCPQADTSITLYDGDGAPISRTCSADGNHPGKAYFGSVENGAVGAHRGAYLESDKPIYMIYEVSASQDEHNLLGTLEP